MNHITAAAGSVVRRPGYLVIASWTVTIIMMAALSLTRAVPPVLAEGGGATPTSSAIIANGLGEVLAYAHAYGNANVDNSAGYLALEVGPGGSIAFITPDGSCQANVTLDGGSLLIAGDGDARHMVQYLPVSLCGNSTYLGVAHYFDPQTGADRVRVSF